MTDDIGPAPAPAGSACVTLLVDDEQPARERLGSCWRRMRMSTSSARPKTALQAAELSASWQPDVVFLDIQMPGAAGWKWPRRWARARPLVVFCTAFDQYAVDAFELLATDYLLKPVNRHAPGSGAGARRLAHEAKRPSVGPWPRDRDAGAAPPGPGAARHRYKVVPRADVIAFTFTRASRGCVTATEQLTMQPTLAALGRRLDAEHAFVQVSRTVWCTSMPFVRPVRSPTAPARSSWPTVRPWPSTRRRWRALVEKLEGHDP